MSSRSVHWSITPSLVDGEDDQGEGEDESVMGEESGGGSASASDVGGGAGSVAGDLDANADIVVHSSNPGSTSARKRKF
jgi:hypothetical protein